MPLGDLGMCQEGLAGWMVAHIQGNGTATSYTVEKERARIYCAAFGIPTPR